MQASHWLAGKSDQSQTPKGIKKKAHSQERPINGQTIDK
jgi:hypothetical protein